MPSPPVKPLLYWPVLLALVIATAAVFFPVINFEATDYDDGNYVFDNPAVLQGLTGQSIKWAFTTGHAANWHPLTWLSHMADVETFGVRTGAHHAINLLLHCANVALVFALFFQFTGFLWRCAFVAALFALHPLHVESVAWIAERKDVLSTFFGLLTLLAYARYLRLPNSKIHYALTLVLFILSLLSKPMLVTLPVVMLLLDFWPLQRPLSLQLITEKIPFFILAFGCGIATILAQSQGGAVRALGALSLWDRIANAAVSCVLYLFKMFWPTRLAAFYPMPDHYSLFTVIGAVVLLLAITTWVILSTRHSTHRTVGWFWFLITVAPVIGLIQVGMQQMADRYTYIPLIGIFLLLTWDFARLAQKFPPLKVTFATAAVVIVIACAVLTRQQVYVWRNSETLFRHALAVTDKNYLAHHNLGYHLFTVGKVNEAIAEYEAALAINPDYTDAHSNLGRAYATQERYESAITHFQAVLRLLPDDVIAHNNLGNTLALLGRHAEAIDHFRAALVVKPNHASAHNNWALSAEELGRTDEAIAHYRAALQIDPNLPAALNNLAWLLATSPDDTLRNGAEAMQHAEQACRLTNFDQPLPLLSLAAATAETGQFTEAIGLTMRARDLAPNDPAIKQRSDAMLDQFNAGKAYRVGNTNTAAPEKQ